MEQVFPQDGTLHYSAQILYASKKLFSTLIIYNFTDYIHVCGHRARADNPIGSNSEQHKKPLFLLSSAEIAEKSVYEFIIILSKFHVLCSLIIR